MPRLVREDEANSPVGGEGSLHLELVCLGPRLCIDHGLPLVHPFCGPCARSTRSRNRALREDTGHDARICTACMGWQSTRRSPTTLDGCLVNCLSGGVAQSRVPRVRVGATRSPREYPDGGTAVRRTTGLAQSADPISLIRSGNAERRASGSSRCAKPVYSLGPPIVSDMSI